MNVGDVVNRRYKVLEVKGRGGMGTVLRCRRLRNDEIVALKYCHLDDANARRRFAREVRSARALEHPNVVPVIALSLKHEPPYFVMPFADELCADKLNEYAADENMALDAFLQVCAGVQAIHSAGLVHRDLKPDNALVFNDEIKISDLGLVKPVERQTTVLTETRVIVGTESYLAPEQRRPGGSRDADQRTDIYQLGKILYEFLTGDDPSIIEIARVPAGIAHVIRKATREHPDERYENVGQLIDAVTVARAARNPAANPLDSFDTVLARINERLDVRQYRTDDIRELLSVLTLPAVQASPEQFLELFDQIPIQILKILPAVDGDAIPQVLECYVRAIDSVVASRAFPYAERIAKRMWAVFSAVDGMPEVKSLCVEAVLLGAVRLNRFAAMTSFNEMLTSLKDDADAMAVYEALNRRRREYKRICEQVPSLKLHASIRPLRDQLETENRD